MVFWRRSASASPHQLDGSARRHRDRDGRLGMRKLMGQRGSTCGRLLDFAAPSPRLAAKLTPTVATPRSRRPVRLGSPVGARCVPAGQQARAWTGRRTRQCCGLGHHNSDRAPARWDQAKASCARRVPPPQVSQDAGQWCAMFGTLSDRPRRAGRPPRSQPSSTTGICAMRGIRLALLGEDVNLEVVRSSSTACGARRRKV
jgi:hypothetical protein